MAQTNKMNLLFAWVGSLSPQGGLWFNFCVVDFALITAFLSVDSPQLQGPEFDQNHGSGPNGALIAPISSLVSVRRPPRGA